MVKRVLLKVSVLLGALLALVVAAYGFRESLLRVAANFWLTDMELTRLQGLQLDAERAAVTALELQLPSGLTIILTDVAVGYRALSLTSAPIVESLQIGSALVLRDPSLRDDISENNADSDTLLLSDLLQLLREFPLSAVTVGRIDVSQYDALAVNLQHRSGELVLQVERDAVQLLVQFTQADAAAPASFQITLARAAEMVGDFHVLLEPAGTTFALNGSGHLQFDDLNTLLGELQQQPLALPLKAASLDWTLAGTVADDVRGTFQTSTPATFVLGMQAGSTFTLPAGMANGAGELNVTFNNSAELTVATGAHPRISGGRVPLLLAGSWQQQPVSINSLFTLADCGLTNCNLKFDGSAAVADYTLAGTIEIDAGDLAADSGRFGIHTTNLQLGGLPGWTPSFDIDAAVVRNGGRLDFNTPLLLRNAPADAGITIAGHYNIESGVAAAQISVPQLQFSEQGRALSAWLSGWPYNFDLLTGAVAAEVDVQWQPAAGTVASVLRADVTATLQDVGGFYGDYFFRGLSTNLQGSADVADAVSLETPPLMLTIASVDVGVPLDNIAATFRFDRANQQLLVSSLSADVLGGTVGGNDLAYNFNRERNPLTLRFDGLQLERMLALADYNGVAASGAVSGELPLTLTATGVEVAGGTLKADAPGGSIRYLAGAAAGVQGNAGVDLVNQVLGNYKFDSLTSNIDYSPEGELLLSMQLQGHNPDMGADQPINLNLNLSDNIPALLKSLQSARAIEDFLQQQQ